MPVNYADANSFGSNNPQRIAIANTLSNIQHNSAPQSIPPQVNETGLPYLSASDSASDNYASLTRAQYNHWLQNTFPKYKEMLGLATSKNFVNEAVQETREGMTAGNAVAAQQQERDLRRYGLQETARQRQARKSSTNLQQTAALTQATNSSRLEAKDAQNTILAGGLGTALNSANEEY